MYRVASYPRYLCCIQGSIVSALHIFVVFRFCFLHGSPLNGTLYCHGGVTLVFKSIMGVTSSIGTLHPKQTLSCTLNVCNVKCAKQNVAHHHHHHLLASALYCI